MSEPLIPNPVPVVKEAIPEKIFDKIYIPYTEILAVPNAPWICMIETVPFDGDSETLPIKFNVKIEDIKACAALVPELATALNAMLTALATVAVAAKATNTKVITPQNIVATLQAVQP